jgi:DNA-binding LacI/PurR family transcriptional regulator
VAINMRIIAEKAGVSTATVSMALRGIGRITPATRDRVRAAAAELGYQVSPILSSAFKLARQPDQSRYKETLAAILEFPLDSSASYQSVICEHAVERGKSLGYKVEAFVLSGRPADHRRLNRLLQARGIRGLIILPRLEHRFPRLHLDWSKYAAVEIGRTLWDPRGLHRVDRPVYYEILEAFHLLKKSGFRRIGMAVEPTADLMRQKVYMAACHVAQEKLPKRQVIPPLSGCGPWGEGTFRTWFKRFHPDVVIIHSLKGVPAWLEAMGLRVPEDVSIFGCNASAGFTGLASNTPLLGENAVEILSILLERDQLGLAENPYNWLVMAKWRQGKTLSKPLVFPVSKQPGAGKKSRSSQRTA